MHIDMGTIGAEHALPAAPQAIDHHQIGLRASDGTVERIITPKQIKTKIHGEQILTLPTD